MKVECFGLIYSTKTVQFNEKYDERTNWPSSWSRKIEIHHGYSLPLKYRDVILSQSLAKTLLFLRSMARRVKPDGKLKVTASHDTYIPSRINTGVKIFLAGNNFLFSLWIPRIQNFSSVLIAFRSQSIRRIVEKSQKEGIQGEWRVEKPNEINFEMEWIRLNLKRGEFLVKGSAISCLLHPPFLFFFLFSWQTNGSDSPFHRRSFLIIISKT